MYIIKHINDMSSIFEIIAEPTRRSILALLIATPLAVGDIGEELNKPQTTVSKHLRVLREAGVVECSVVAQRRVYRLRSEPLRELDSWISQFRELWSPRLDALEQHLDGMSQSNSLRIAGDSI